MKNYTRVAHGITPEEVGHIIQLGMRDVSKQATTEKSEPGFRYPGVTLSDSFILMPTILHIADLAVGKSKWHKLTYDKGIGTGINFLRLEEGDKLPKHADHPLYELDEDFKIKEGYDKRKCALTVVIGLRASSYTGGAFSLIDNDTGISTMFEVETQALVYRSDKMHSEISEVIDGVAYFITAFLCCDK